MVTSPSPKHPCGDSKAMPQRMMPAFDLSLRSTSPIPWSPKPSSKVVMRTTGTKMSTMQNKGMKTNASFGDAKPKDAAYLNKNRKNHMQAHGSTCRLKVKSCFDCFIDNADFKSTFEVEPLVPKTPPKLLVNKHAHEKAQMWSPNKGTK
jgi:hypothetical protein